MGRMGELLEHRKLNMRFSNKRYYDLAMRCYDVGLVGMMEEDNVRELFESQGKSEREYKQEILKACENLNYIDSRLYLNCKK